VIVISAGMQKAASASYFNLINAMLMAAGYEDVHLLRQKFGFGFFMSSVNCNVGPLRAYKLAWLSIPHWLGQSLVVKTHEPPSPSARLLTRLGLLKPTYIFRDPRDVAVSLYEHGERLRRDGLNSRTQFDQLKTLGEAIQFTGRLMPIWRAWTGLEGCLSARFEEFTIDMLREAKRLNSHLGLGLDEPVLREITRRLDPTSTPADALSRSMHLHSGKRGRWETRMSDSDKELCREVLGPHLPAMGYGQDAG
jgi:hypothetical protein